MNFAEADYVMTNTPGMLRAMAKKMTDLGVRPEIEAFDTGHLWFAKQLVKEGLIEDPVLKIEVSMFQEAQNKLQILQLRLQRLGQL